MNGFLVRRILRKGRKTRGRFFDVLVSNSSNCPQTTVICSSKVSKRAVVRNRIKRQIREYVRMRRQAGDFANEHVVAIVRPQAVAHTFADFVSDNF